MKKIIKTPSGQKLIFVSQDEAAKYIFENLKRIYTGL